MRERLILLLLHILCVPHGLSQESILQYDKATGLLHFSCPLESEMRDKKLLMANFGRYNQRTSDGQTSRIAKWFNHTVTNYEKGTVLNNTRLMGLTGYLKDVRCEDSRMYYCSYHYTLPGGHIERRVENITFTFEGPLSVSIAKPLKTQHCAGETIELKCRASLGRQNNTIVWESKAPGEEFSSDHSNKTNHSVPMDTKNCNYYAESTLSRVLTPSDNGRVWRCRLTDGDVTDDVIIAVDQTKVPEAQGENSADLGLTTVQARPGCRGEFTGFPITDSRFTTHKVWREEPNTFLTEATFALIILALLTGVVVIIRRNCTGKCKNFKLRNDESTVFLVSCTAHESHNEELAPARSEPLILPPLGDVDEDDGYAGFSDDQLNLATVTSDLQDSQDAILGQASAVSPPLFDPDYSQLDGNTEDYSRIGRHGNSHKVVNWASPAELSYHRLCPTGHVLETPVCD